MNIAAPSRQNGAIPKRGNCGCLVVERWESKGEASLSVAQHLRQILLGVANGHDVPFLDQHVENGGRDERGQVGAEPAAYWSKKVRLMWDSRMAVLKG